MRLKPYFAPIFMFFMGIAVFFNVSGRPTVQAYRTVDVLSLIERSKDLRDCRTATAKRMPAKPRHWFKRRCGPTGKLNSSYFSPTTIESGPTRCSTWASLNPASFIHPMQSAPV
jgi:hypothetical protein